MRQILWFRRDLRIRDSGILAEAKEYVLPIFIFDTNILKTLSAEDKRVQLLYHAVDALKSQLQTLGLELTVFYGDPVEVFSHLVKKGFDEVVASVDFDAYAKERDAKIEALLPFKRVYDSFLLHPDDILKADGGVYRVFTPFYNTAKIGFDAAIMIETPPMHLKQIPFSHQDITLKEMGFKQDMLPEELTLSAKEKIALFKSKVSFYERDRDFFYKDASSDIGIYLRFGLISVRELLSIMIEWKKEGLAVESYVRQLFWREFYHYILYHFPESETVNFDSSEIPWREDEKAFAQWCKGETGVPIIDAAMMHLKKTGRMHNRLRMITASFLTKNLLIDWRLGEKHFARYLLDYEASSNIGSWQWAAGTGADAAPYFRVFNPYLQSKKFDEQGRFIKAVMPQLATVDAKYLHEENGIQGNILYDYPPCIVDIKKSRQRAIEVFKKARNAA